ncbi:MAG TPA: hypothetical protein VMI54_25120 [Polyangiaceae bacterium]|nr:hypothetical protein [Polyangiaceae bacterium]
MDSTSTSSAISPSNFPAEKRISFAHIEASEAPYPGLRPFDLDEADIFFGRERQTDQLLEKLQQHRFLAVVGPSGCGKSSLVNAGLIAALQTGFMADAGARWLLARLRPGDRPIARLADAVLESGLLPTARASHEESEVLTRAALLRGPLGLLELAEESGLKQRGNLLVVVDQFEELFRFEAHGNRDEAEAFVALLLASAQAVDTRVYIVITMRSDFLGRCAVFHGLPEAINEGEYLTPRLTREECESAITGPARVCGGSLEPQLVNRLLNDVGPDPDQLPLLQHALMRMWSLHEPELRADGKPVRLVVADYDAINRLSSALSDHADEAFAELDAGSQRIAEVMFRRLCDATSANRDTRTPARVGEVADVAGATVGQVIAVANAFRRSDRCFLVPREEQPLVAESMLDVSHESLLRQWRRLVGWIEDEAESAAFYRRMRETALAWRREDAALWGTPDLDRAIAWRTRAQPTAAWARRYGSEADFTVACEFLEKSIAKREGERERLKAAREEELRRARRVAMISTATAAALIVGILGYLVMFVFEYRVSYANLVRRNGVPSGIGRLNPEQAKHRALSFVIVKSGWFGHVKRVEAQNGHGHPMPTGEFASQLQDPDAPRLPVAAEFGYDTNDRVAYQTNFGVDKEPISGFVFVPSGKRATKRAGYFVGADGRPSSAVAYSPGVEIEYDQRGLETAIRYRNSGGAPMPGPDKAFGRKIVYDAEGRLLQLISTDRNGQRMNDTYGNSEYRVDRCDAFGNELETTDVDAAGHVIAVKGGWAKRKRTMDANGNMVSDAYFDAAGNPVASKDGYHKFVQLRDAWGDVVAEHYYGTRGEPAVEQTGCHGFLLERDGLGRTVVMKCVDQRDRAAYNKWGFSISHYAYDADDNVLEESYFDVNGRPIASNLGYARASSKYDSRDNRISQRYLGSTDEPVLSNRGYAGWTADYDRSGHQTRFASVGTDEKPIAGKSGYATTERTFDEYGNQLQERYFDPSGKPAVDADGWFGWQARYDQRGNKLEMTAIGADGLPTATKDGYAGWRTEYDDFGNKTSQRYVDVYGAVVADATVGIAQWSATYDVQGRELERHYLSPRGLPITARNGNAGAREKYDSRGNAIEYSYFDVNGHPALESWDDVSLGNDGGFSRVVRTYDDHGRLVEQAYFGIHGEPIKSPNGWASRKLEYDSRGNNTRVRYFGVTGAPVLIQERYHAIGYAFDEHGNAVETSYFDLDGRTLVGTRKGYARLVTAFDRVGRAVEERAFNAQGKPSALSNQGEHLVRKGYDAQGHEVSEAYFDDQELPFLNRAGIHRKEYLFGIAGDKVEERHFDASGKLVSSSAEPCAVQRWRHDDQHHEVEEACFGADEKPALDQDKRASAQLRWGDRNELLEVRYLGVNRELLAGAHGYAGFRYRYDDLGRRAEIEYFNAREQPAIESESGAAYIEYEFDVFGAVNEERLYGLKHEPIVGNLGYHRYVTVQDNQRHLLEMSTFGTDGSLLLNKARFARAKWSYDERGDQVGISYFGLDGKLTPSGRGYARESSTYDTFGNELAHAYFDALDRPFDAGSGARVEFSYDTAGNQVEERRFDARGLPRAPLAKIERTFDAHRRLLEERFLGPDGRPARKDGTRGEWVTRFDYDVFGNKTAEHYFDADGKPAFGVAPNGELCRSWQGVYDGEGKLTHQTCGH